MNKKTLVALFLVALTTSSCLENPKETGGALLGGAGGALIGSTIGGGSGRLVAVAAGAILGSIAGSAIGRSLDENDRRMAAEATQRSLNTGQTEKWQRVNSNNEQVTIEVAPRRLTNDGCREYQQTVSIGGRTQQAYGRACKDRNGDWQIVNN